MPASPAPASGDTVLDPLPTTIDAEERRERLSKIANEIRRSVVEMIGRARLGHIGGDFSTTDSLTTLFFAVLRVDPTAAAAPRRDRFILSKGHCAAALYSTLALRGFFPVEQLKTFMQPLSALNGHPNRRKVPGVEANTGPLGHGLPIGVGAPIAAKLPAPLANVRRPRRRRACRKARTGRRPCAPAIASWTLSPRSSTATACSRGPAPRTPIVSSRSPTNGARSAGRSSNATAMTIRRSMKPSPPRSTGRPRCVIANTIKGKGVSFIEDRVEWHHKVPSPEQVELALKELAR